MKRIYLDWAATAKPDLELLQKALTSSINDFANPSSPHKSGKEASKNLEQSRKRCCSAFGCKPDQLFFTGGGTESNNIILNSLLRKPKTGNIIISGIEHSSVYEPALRLKDFGWEVRILFPGNDGRISPEEFASKVDKDTILASCMMVNNETGAIQPVEEIGTQIKDSNRRTHFHVDAVQAAGKISLNLESLPVDSASISSHKFRGPRGAGLLYLNKQIDPLYSGGGQEAGVRDGTENLFGAIATAAAADKALAGIIEQLEHALKLKTVLINRISELKTAFFIPACGRDKLLDTELFSPYITSVSIKPVPAEILVRVMSDRGFDISTGSACATGNKKKSRIMDAMGISAETAFSTVRISTGPDTELEEIEQFCETFIRESSILVKQLKG